MQVTSLRNSPPIPPINNVLRLFTSIIRITLSILYKSLARNAKRRSVFWSSAFTTPGRKPLGISPNLLRITYYIGKVIAHVNMKTNPSLTFLPALCCNCLSAGCHHHWELVALQLAQCAASYKN